MTGRHSLLSAMGSALLGASFLVSCASPTTNDEGKGGTTGTPGSCRDDGHRGLEPAGRSRLDGHRGLEPAGRRRLARQRRLDGRRRLEPAGRGRLEPAGRGRLDGRRGLEPAGRGRLEPAGDRRRRRWFDGRSGLADRHRWWSLLCGRQRRRDLRLRRGLRRDGQAGWPDRLLADLQQHRRPAEPDPREAAGDDGGQDPGRACGGVHELRVPLVGDRAGQLRRLQRHLQARHAADGAPQRDGHALRRQRVGRHHVQGKDRRWTDLAAGVRRDPDQGDAAGHLGRHRDGAGDRPVQQPRSHHDHQLD